MTLQAGDKAPEITAQDQDGKTFTLGALRGKKVALYFYPKDDTPTCTTQACNLRDNIALLKRKKITVVGVSTDPEKKHQKFRTKHALPFTLLADTDQRIVTDYGVWGEKKLYGRAYMGTHRTTFLINEDGNIAHIIDKVVSADHAAQIIATWGL
jgi:thioredoxin-dependent peroxiredoxin